MKKATIEALKRKFENDICDINCTIRNNKREINHLAAKQKTLKEMKKELHKLLNQINGYE